MNQLPPSEPQKAAESQVESELRQFGRLLDEFFVNINI